MKRFCLSLFVCLFVICEMSSQKIIIMEEEGGVYRIPCAVNGAKMKMVFDTGASDISLSMSIAEYLLDNDYIKKDDIIGKGQAVIADGSSINTYNLILRDVEIDGLHLYNVEASISASQNAPLLLGQSAIQKLGRISIEGNRLIINSVKSNITSEDITKLRNEIEEAMKQDKTYITLEKLEQLKNIDDFTELDYTRLTFYYWLAGKYKECISAGLEYLNKNVVEKERNLGIICEMMGQSHMAIKDLPKAEEYFKRALEYYDNDKTKYESLYRFLGIVNLEMHKYDLAMSYLKKSGDLSMDRIGCKAIDIDKGYVQDSQLSNVLYNIFLVYYYQGQNNTANNWLRASAQCGNKKAQELCIQNGIKFKIKTKKK